MALGGSRWSEHFHTVLSQADAVHRRRQRRIVPLDGVVDFGSNDYLGLRWHPAVLAAVQHEPLDTWGAGGSPLVGGYTPGHARLEQALAEFAGAEAALVFSSGFAANCGTIACLASEGDLILSDQLNHASLIDGCRLSRATTFVYRHADVESVREHLQQQRHRYRRGLLVTESLFSMDGDRAPLVELAELAERFDVGLVVDEAHAVGVYGVRGAGLLEEWQLTGRELAKLGTLSKAVGGSGGYVAGSHELIEYLVNTCRSYMFSTAPPAASMRAAYAAVQLLMAGQTQRQALRRRAAELRAQLRHSGWQVAEGDSPIIPLQVGSEAAALQLSQHLWQAGLYAPAIRPPTVPPHTCRLRISLTLRHTAEQCQQLVDALNAWRSTRGSL